MAYIYLLEEYFATLKHFQNNKSRYLLGTINCNYFFLIPIFALNLVLLIFSLERNILFIRPSPVCNL